MKKWWFIFIALVVLAGLFWIGCRLSDDSQQNGVDKTPVVIDDEKNESESENDPAENGGNGQEEPEPDPEDKEPSEDPSQEPGETDYNKYDNKKYAWYVLRKSDHSTPGTGAGMAELVNKYGGFYLGDTSQKVVYLTFDEGYEYGYTPKILDILRDNNVKAAFFITLPYLNKNPELVERMVNEGHIVGNHTVSHPSLPEVDNQKIIDEIEGLNKAFRERTGLDMRYLRPPKGEFSERTLKISSDLGYRNVFWSSAYDDWDVNKQKGADYAYKMVMDNVHNGNVILLHAVSQSNTEALDRIIKDLKAQGYRFGTLDEIN
ncbi:MAG TPA: delta-lactam-biosynthetic de-N-acetylase [Syntrophomonadaceae bacterium]|nr:delta-lactam-biosynthetic de-N-acetylase [Syntrophomonadaceae bacterium]